MKAHEERVIIEKNSLDDKIARLKSFLAAEHNVDVAEDDVKLLREQLVAMELYSNILQRRIDRFVI